MHILEREHVDDLSSSDGNVSVVCRSSKNSRSPCLSANKQEGAVKKDSAVVIWASNPQPATSVEAFPDPRQMTPAMPSRFNRPSEFALRGLQTPI